MIEEDDLAGQDHDGTATFRWESVGHGRLEDSGHVVRQVPANAAGHGRELAQILRPGDRQGPHAGAQAGDVVLSAECHESVQSGVVALHVEFTAPAGQNQSVIPADETISTQTAVHFGTFEQKALLVAHEGQVQGDGGLGVRREPGSLLG